MADGTRRTFSRLAFGMAFGLGAAAAGPVGARPGAAAYPQGPVRIVVPFAAGGGPDLLTRSFAVRLAEALGQPVVVQNIVGAGGIVAALSTANAAPDGYTVLLGASSHLVQKAMQPEVRFDPLSDFAPVARIAFSPSILVVGADSRWRSTADLVAAAKAAPGRFNYASGGVGSAAHLCGAALALQADLDVVHVPYKGSVDIVPSIVRGDTHFAFPIASTAVPMIRAGKVRALAVTGAQRLPALPDVPTLVELFGVPDLALDAWFGLWMPVGTPSAIVDRLFDAVVAASADPELRARNEAAGTRIATSASPAEFAAFMRTETLKFGRIVRFARLNASER